MLNKKLPVSSGRSLPQRIETFSTNSSTLSLPNYVWFTPEVVILDAFRILAEAVLLWQYFKRVAPVFAFRVAALTALFFLVIGFRYQPVLVAADTYQPKVISKSTSQIQIKTAITARAKPVYSWPVPKNYLTTYFSARHQGIDIPNPYASPVRAFSGGTVTFTGWDGGFGKTIRLRHKNGLVSKYAHLSSISVRRGDVVSRTAIIGRVGTTGVTTGPHLHFETRRATGPLNPLNLLP